MVYHNISGLSVCIVCMYVHMCVCVYTTYEILLKQKDICKKIEEYHYIVYRSLVKQSVALIWVFISSRKKVIFFKMSKI